MMESRIDNFHVEIKSEPQEYASEEGISSSCIEFQNMAELELKYEAEDDHVEEHARDCTGNLPHIPALKFRQPTGFEEDLEELDRSMKKFREKHEEELILRKFFKLNFKSDETYESCSILFDMLTRNLRSLDEQEMIEPDTGFSLIVLSLNYPEACFDSSHLSALKKAYEELYNPSCASKVELKNGFIKVVHQKGIDKAMKIFGNAKDIKHIKDDSSGQLWMILVTDPQKKPFSADKPAFPKVRLSLKDLKNLKEFKSPTDIKIKEEPQDNPEPAVSDVQIKQEIEDQPMLSNLPLYLTEDQAGTSQQEDTYIITEVGDVKQETMDDFTYFTANFPETSSQNHNDDDDEDEFQYNTVNSFKSDLATRRSVSHTVVSGKSEKSKAQAALLAMQELLKIEQDKRVEKERSAAGLNQAEKPKTMNVSLNVNGVRVVTKVPLPNVTAAAKKPVKSVEEECKHQCPICFIKFKTEGQLIGHKRIHDTAKAKLNTADMTKNVYREVRMRIEQIGNRRSIHVLLPNYDYAFIVTNSTANKLYMKCFRQACEVKAYSTNDGKFFVKVGDEHCHGPDRKVILSKIDEKKRSDLEKTEVINKSVQEAIAQKQRQKSQMEEKKHALIERIKRSQEAAGGKRVIQEVKRRKL